MILCITVDFFESSERVHVYNLTLESHLNVFNVDKHLFVTLCAFEIISLFLVNFFRFNYDWFVGLGRRGRRIWIVGALCVVKRMRDRRADGLCSRTRIDRSLADVLLVVAEQVLVAQRVVLIVVLVTVILLD